MKDMEKNVSIEIRKVTNGFIVTPVLSMQHAMLEERNETLVFNELKGYSGRSLVEFLEDHFGLDE